MKKARDVRRCGGVVIGTLGLLLKCLNRDDVDKDTRRGVVSSFQ